MPRILLFRLLLALLCLGLIAPIAVVVIVSFSGDTYLRFPPDALSMRWYARFFGDSRWRDALWNSLAVATMTAAMATAAGFLAAYATVRGHFWGKRALVAMLLAPLVVPHVVTAVALYFLSARFGLLGFRPWLALAHSVLALPVVMVLLQSAIHATDPNLERAAMICGCSRIGVFCRVVMPTMRPALFSAALFAFLTSFDELMVALFLAGVRSETLPVRIWNSLLLEVEPTIAAVSTLLIAVTAVFLLFNAMVRTKH